MGPESPILPRRIGLSGGFAAADERLSSSAEERALPARAYVRAIAVVIGRKGGQRVAAHLLQRILHCLDPRRRPHR
jgi:hypothetical protein